MTGRTEEPRRLLTRARAAAEAELDRMVTDGVMPVDTAVVMAGTGFTAVTRVLSELYVSGLSAGCITEAFERNLRRAHTDGDQWQINSSEFILAIWRGMQEDLVTYLRRTETER